MVTSMENTACRTDLVDEMASLSGAKRDIAGCRVTERTEHGCRLCEVDVLTPEGERNVGKPRGRYISYDIGQVRLMDKARFYDTANLIADGITSLLPEKEGAVLFAALGNRAVTADAVGPMAAEQFIVTSPIKKENPALFDGMRLRETYCVVPDVLGNTGLEAASIIRGVVDKVRPVAVIAADALAARRLGRLATTVQLCDTGISPGSGIRNARPALNAETLGVPVIAIGVPTVVEAGTLAFDVLETALAQYDAADAEQCRQMLRGMLLPSESGYFVTPKETDRIIKDVSKLIAVSLNRALQRSLTFDEMDELTA